MPVRIRTRAARPSTTIWVCKGVGMRREEILARMGMRLPLHKQMRVIISSDVANEADDQ